MLGKKLTFEAIYESEKPPKLSGDAISEFDWLEDGEHYLQLRDGKVWKIEARTGKAEAFPEPSAMAKALGELPTVGESRGRDWAKGRLNMDEKRTGAFFTHENDLYYARVDGTLACRLTATPEPEEMPVFSPNGEFVAFVRNNDLWVVDVRTQTERRLTTGGTDLLRNGKADWVYFEEIFHRNWRTFWWSPDSQRIAFMRIDSSQEPRYYLTDDKDLGQVLENAPYPKAGQPNPRAKLGVVTVAGGDVRWADLSGYTVDDMLISSVGWWAGSSVIYFTVQNRIQTWLDFCTLPVGGGDVKKLFRETTKAWVEVLADPKFLKDGSFLFQSERDGWRHLYHYGADGQLKKRITEGGFEVRGLVRVDEESGWVYFSGTKDSPISSNLYRVPLGGGEIERLTIEAGSHAATLAPKGTLFVDSWSSHKQPARVVLRDAAHPSAVVRTLDANPVYALEEYALGSFELFQITGDNGEVYEAAICKPGNFDPGKKYPLWFTTYGGPHAPSVSDSWSGGRAWDQILAAKGIIVLRADNSTASGKGAISTWPAYKQMGVEECADVERIIHWVKSQPWVDENRIGMSGHSFGGFLTAYCLTHTKLFASGIAGAPVTDWREYDSIYTERYMDTPQNNPEGYEKTSVIAAAKNLHGRLLILHGTIDDNVHPQNTIRLERALQEANMPFEMMIYPGNRHGISGRHNNRQIYDFIQRTMNSQESTVAERPKTNGPEKVAGASSEKGKGPSDGSFAR